MSALAEAVLDLAELALPFGRINRTAVYHAGGVTSESDTDHTVMLGWTACSLAERCFPHLDVYARRGRRHQHAPSIAGSRWPT